MPEYISVRVSVYPSACLCLRAGRPGDPGQEDALRHRGRLAGALHQVTSSKPPTDTGQILQLRSALTLKLLEIDTRLFRARIAPCPFPSPHAQAPGLSNDHLSHTRSLIHTVIVSVMSLYPDPHSQLTCHIPPDPDPNRRPLCHTLTLTQTVDLSVIP